MGKNKIDQFCIVFKKIAIEYVSKTKKLKAKRIWFISVEWRDEWVVALEGKII